MFHFGAFSPSPQYSFEAMEIDFTDLKLSSNGTWVTVAGLLAAILMGLLGWFVLPDGKVLSWTEWQVFKQQRTYQRELTRLTRDADRLADLLGEDLPDPVRGQLVVEQVLANLNATSHPALAHQVDALLAANDAIYFWVLGSVSKDDAIALLDEANQGILHAIEAQRSDPQRGVEGLHPEPVEGPRPDPQRGVEGQQ